MQFQGTVIRKSNGSVVILPPAGDASGVVSIEVTTVTAGFDALPGVNSIVSFTLDLTNLQDKPLTLADVAPGHDPLKVTMNSLDVRGAVVRLTEDAWAKQMVEQFAGNTGAPGSPDEEQFKRVVAVGVVNNDADGYLAYRYGAGSGGNAVNERIVEAINATPAASAPSFGRTQPRRREAPVAPAPMPSTES